MNDKSLWLDYQTNKNEANKKRLVLAYVNLVHYVIHNTNFNFDSIKDERDLFEYGIEGLNEAIDRYVDGSQTQRFETFAIQRIRMKIIDKRRELQNVK